VLTGDAILNVRGDHSISLHVSVLAKELTVHVCVFHVISYCEFDTTGVSLVHVMERETVAVLTRTLSELRTLYVKVTGEILQKFAVGVKRIPVPAIVAVPPVGLCVTDTRVSVPLASRLKSFSRTGIRIAVSSAHVALSLLAIGRSSIQPIERESVAGVSDTQPLLSTA
jgi:hypothetical protein